LKRPSVIAIAALGAFGLLVALTLLLALPGRRRQPYARAVCISFFVVPLPLLLFYLSLLLVPQAKDGCLFGALDCFQCGKIALTPIVLWAVAALYTMEVLQPPRLPRWAVWGLVSGAVVSAVTFAIFAVVNFLVPLVLADRWQLLGSLPQVAFVLALPGYVAVWYAMRARELVGRGLVHPPDVIGIAVVNAPFFVASAWKSQLVYARLPARPPPGCFVVTAATRGHEAVVGPLVEVAPGRRANRQIVRFWIFEERWRRGHPSSHATMRCFYDRLGPRLAARIRAPWQADLVYLALKPLELVAILLGRAPVAPRRVGRRHAMKRVDATS
jgi:hypothetical protein